jgi:hypothetical protein
MPPSIFRGNGLGIGTGMTRLLADVRRWWMPLLAGVGTLVVVGAAFFILLPHIGQPKSGKAPPALQDAQSAAEAGKRALADGNFFLADHELSCGVRPVGSDANSVDSRNFEQLRRQASLLCRLHGRSLEEILNEALPLRSDDEWQARFRAEHLGKAILFDDVVGVDSVGRPALSVYRVQIGREKARIALEDLRLLSQLPLNPPQRLLFGGTLANLAREEGGTWVFHFEPESGVLLTDFGAVAACLGPSDADLLAVLRRQQQWLNDLVPRTGHR